MYEYTLILIFKNILKEHFIMQQTHRGLRADQIQNVPAKLS